MSSSGEFAAICAMRPDVPPAFEPQRFQDGQSSSLSDPSTLRVPGPSKPRMQRSDSFTSTGLQLHEFPIQSSNKHPWATLRLRSSAPSSKSLPIFFEGQKIRGEVELHLRKPESIKSIVISIEGIATVGLEERTFLQQSETIWQEETGNPRTSSTEVERPKYSGELIGTYQWPFSLSLPPKVSASSKVSRDLGLRLEERLPPNMQNSGWDSAICYRLALTIKRHGLFRSESMVSTLFGYTPLTRPGLPSDARRRAYKRNTPLPGPALDPIGWQVMRRVNISGTIHGRRESSVTYTLAFATPLSYTRGSVLPVHLTVQSLDTQALDALSSPLAPNLVLRRKLTRNVSFAPAGRIDPDEIKESEAKPLAKAIWTPSNSAMNESERCLEGEIIVPLSCTPSFQFGGLSQEYFIDMLPPSPACFQPSFKEAILSHTPISIASAHPERSYRPVAYITPAHDFSRRLARSDALAALQRGSVHQIYPASRPSTAMTTQESSPHRPQEPSGVSPIEQTKRPKPASWRFSTF